MKLYIDGWKQHICFSAAHFLTQHEKCSLLHGHTYIISCTIEGTPDSKTHMILDFTKIKQILNRLIEPLDHHILIPAQQSLVNTKTSTITITNKNKTYTIPKEDCVILPLPSTTAEHIAQYLLAQLVLQLSNNQNIQKILIQIDEGLGQSAIAEQIL
jgi:6-pyruvoyltetrahydropterin/6-carboxytetrahydropterin synthase